MQKPHFIILGGGPAGLAMAYFATKKQKSFLLLEKNNELGGNATTFNHHDFLYDSGAHRWHNVHPHITHEIKNLLQEDFFKVNKKSAIFYKGKFVHFPLSPINMFLTLSKSEIFYMLKSFFRRKSKQYPQNSFAQYIQQKYGEKVCQAFLWGYTEKLWGEDPRLLSQTISGKRLKGLDIKSFIRKNEEHLDGKFYYPRFGIRQILTEIEKKLNQSHILLNSDIQSIKVQDEFITEIKTKNQVIDTTASIVINTLAPNTFLSLAGNPRNNDFKFRTVMLIFFAIKKKLISPFASLYFPEDKYSFNRVVEPKNRSSHMAPSTHTSLVFEFALEDNNLNSNERERKIEEATSCLIHDFKIPREDILSHEIKILPQAYPKLTLKSIEEKMKYTEQVKQIKNLELLGRNAEFEYLHLHDLFFKAEELSGL